VQSALFHVLVDESVPQIGWWLHVSVLKSHEIALFLLDPNVCRSICPQKNCPLLPDHLNQLRHISVVFRGTVLCLEIMEASTWRSHRGFRRLESQDCSHHSPTTLW
jgi:hypothetical protein